MLREQLLDQYHVEAAVLTGWLNASALQEGWTEFKTALMSAYNDWQVEHGLTRDERLYGSVHVNAWDPEGAVREIERMAVASEDRPGDALRGDRAVRRPALPPASSLPRQRHGLVGRRSTTRENSPTALGRHRYFAEWHTLVSQVFMSQAVSLVFNGVFELLPRAQSDPRSRAASRTCHISCGAPTSSTGSSATRCRGSSGCQAEMIRDTVRFATQPIEEFTARQLTTLIEPDGVRRAGLLFD